MAVEKRTADEWFELWDQLAFERREIAAERHNLPASAPQSEHDRLDRAYAVAFARAEIASVRCFLAKNAISEAEIADLMS